MRFRKFVYCFVILFLVASTSLAKEPNTEHTFKLADKPPPVASISDAQMLIGSWAGNGFGSRIEEVWNSPSAGTMIGMFKVFDEQKGVSFYELMLIVEEGDSLVLKVKHFSADFTGWEKKDDYVRFPLVAVEENALHFAGLSFYQMGSNSLEVYVSITEKNGNREEKLSYQRVYSKLSEDRYR